MNERKDPFASAKMLVAGFDEQREAFKAADSAFFKEKPVGFRWEPDPTGEYNLFKLRVTKEPPSRLRRLAYAAVNDIRNALDHALYASVTALTGKSPGRNVHFPFANDPADLEEAFASPRHASIPKELRPVLASFEPYPTGDGHSGGNDLLKALNLIAQPNKHQVALAINLNFQSLNIRILDGFVGLGKVANFDLPKILNEGEITLFTSRADRGTVYDFAIPFFTAFAEGGLIKGQEVPATLTRMGLVVRVIVGELERQTRRILQARL